MILPEKAAPVINHLDQTLSWSSLPVYYMSNKTQKEEEEKKNPICI